MRYNIYENGKLIGEDYTRENGEWSHRWFCKKTKGFERGSWIGRAEGVNMEKWDYVEQDKNNKI